MSRIKKIITSSVLAALLVENTFVVGVFAADSASGTFKMYTWGSGPMQTTSSLLRAMEQI